MTHTCKRAIRDRNRLYKRFKRTKTQLHETIWRNKACETRVIINLAKLRFKQKLMNTLNDPNLAPKKYWSLVKRIYGSKKGLGIPVIEKDDNQLTTSTAKAKAFTEFFQEQQTLHVPEGHLLPPEIRLTDQTLDSVSATPAEISKVLKSLETGKAHGADGVSNRLLKETADSICEPLSALINRSFELGKVPSSWKKANVSPVHKKNERSIVSNYRPISLLSTLSKVQERIVYKSMYRFLSQNGLLTAKNSGFKERDSAICQLINIVDKIYKAIEDDKDVCMVFLDVPKAFDRVWHKGLLHKLKNNGIDGKLLEWLESYLSDREIRVVINGQTAPWAKTNAGVPQGSILGPLLFLVFINDVVDNIESDINLFADDTSLMKTVEQIVTAYDAIDRDLRTLSVWSDQWMVKYNATKTVLLHISTKRARVVHPILTLKGTPIAELESHCHLGVDIESKFSWQTHIQKIANKATKCVGLMRRVCRDLPRSTLENLYTTMVRPVLEYGNILVDGSPLAHTCHLDRVQREAALVCTGAYKHTRNINLMEELGWDSLSTRRKNQKLCLMYKIQNDIAPSYLSDSCPP
jgi:hypothetical protein